MVIAGLLLLIYLTALGAADSTLWRRHAIRVHHLSSVVVGDNLYLDGGETINHGPGFAISGVTLQINLASSWITSNVIAAYGYKPLVYPYAREPALWSDGNSLYSTGGILFYFRDCTFSCQDPIWTQTSDGGVIVGANEDGHVNPGLASKLQGVGVDIWQFPFDYFGFEYNGNRQRWFRANYQIPTGYSTFQATVGASYGDRYYAMSGFSGEPFGSRENTNWLRGVPGIASWNVDGSDWKNVSTRGFKPGGTVAMGKGVPAPFGDKGSIVYFGGYAPKKDSRFNFTSSNVLADMSQINIYDIASKTFLSQRTTGDIPINRWGLCAVGVSEARSGTFDIFMFGGFYGFYSNETLRPSLQKVYVLSLPSFTWTETTTEKVQMRANSACEVVGNRQMIVVGGSNPGDEYIGASADPWTNFIGLFDMTEWKWNFEYNAAASPYVRHEKLVRLTREQKYARSWDSIAVQDLFQHNLTTYPSSENGSSTSLGVKVGVPVAIVGFVLLVAIIIWWQWKRRKSSGQEASRTQSDDGDITHYVEAPDKQMPLELSAEKKTYELGPFMPHELQGSGRSPDEGTGSWKTVSPESATSHTVMGELAA